MNGFLYICNERSRLRLSFCGRPDKIELSGPTTETPMISFVEVQKFKDSLFSVFYIMSETSSSREISRSGWVWSIFLLFVEFAQNVATFISPPFGWNSSLTNAILYVNVGSVFRVFSVPGVDLDLSTIQRWATVVCIVVVVFAFADAVYVMLEFRRRKFERIWAAKLLRVVVKATFSVGFTSFFSYVVAPVTSEFYSGGGGFFGATAPLSPFSAPNVYVVVPIAFLGFLYFLVAALSALLFADYDPLSLEPNAQVSHPLFDQTCVANPPPVDGSCRRPLHGHQNPHDRLSNVFLAPHPLPLPRPRRSLRCAFRRPLRNPPRPF